MAESDDPLARATERRDALVRHLRDRRDDVLDPSAEFDHDDFTSFIRERLYPQFEAEADVLYDRVDEEAGSDLATEALRADHEAIERRVESLATGDPDGASLPLQLHEITALVEHHVRADAETVLPYLAESLDDEAFASLVDSLDDRAGVTPGSSPADPGVEPTDGGSGGG